MAMDHVDYGMDYESMEVMMENPHEIAEKQILDRDFFNGTWCCFARPALSDERALACRPCLTQFTFCRHFGAPLSAGRLRAAFGDLFSNDLS